MDGEGLEQDIMLLQMLRKARREMLLEIFQDLRRAKGYFRMLIR
jgi:hypothetical protein